MSIKICYNCEHFTWIDWNIVRANSKFTPALIPNAFCKNTVDVVLGLEAYNTCDYERRKGECGMEGKNFKPSKNYQYQLNKMENKNV